MFPRSAVLLWAGVALAGPLTSTATAQIRASERGMVSQTVDGTTITVDYGRPKARGRDRLFGGVVPWGKVWTPGANWATTISVDKDITLNGRAVTAGTYSVWLEVQPGQWTAILEPDERRFHLSPPAPSDDQVRFMVQPQQTQHVEVLTWSFPEFHATGTTMELAWGETRVSFDITVEPSRPVTVSADFAKRFVGSYRMVREEPLGGGEVGFEIEYQNDRLVAHWESAPVPRLRETWLISLGAGMFAPAELEEGEIFDIVMDLIFEFTPLEGEAATFELRGPGDGLWATGERMR